MDRCLLVWINRLDRRFIEQIIDEKEKKSLTRLRNEEKLD